MLVRFIRDLPNQLQLRPQLAEVPYWVGAVMVGLWAVGYSVVYDEAYDLIRAIETNHPYFLFVTSPVAFFFATWLVDRFAPDAGGTGIPRVDYALKLDSTIHLQRIDQILNWRVLLVICASSILVMLGAGALGREGPMVHMGACIFYIVGHQFRHIWPVEEHRSWIVAGASAGVAAAFNAPLAGVVFVLEELAQQNFHRFKTTVITAAIVGGAVAQWLSGRYILLGYPRVGTVGFDSIPWAILAGVACGLSAAPFHWLLSVDWRGKFRKHFRTRLQFAAAMGILSAALVVFLHPNAMGGGTRIVEGLLFDKGIEPTWKLFLARLVGPIISHLSGAAGGFLAPSLALGATVGGLVAELTSYTNSHLLEMVGMTAFLSAVIRAPFTAWVIVMEMTDRHSAIFPLMVASLVSYATVRRFVNK